MSESSKTPLIGGRLAIMMFLEFFIWGAWYVSMGGFLAGMVSAGTFDGSTWGGSTLGWAYSVCPVAAIISPFILGMLADRFFNAERILGVLQILGGVAFLALPPLVEQYGQGVFMPLLLLHAICFMPSLGLTNTIAMKNMTNQEKQFPLIRVFGTIGWIVAGIVLSKLLLGGSFHQFTFAGGACVLMGLYAFSLPSTPPAMKGQKVAVRDVLCLDALAMLKDRNYLVFMLGSMLICIPLAAYYASAAAFVGGIGIAEPVFKMTFGQMSEIIFMIIMPLFFAKLGVKKMLVLGMLAWVVRYGLFSFGAVGPVAWMVLVGILLHGICYDFFFVTGQIYTDKKAPDALRGQAQGFLVLMTLGVGLLIGAQLVGKIQGQLVTPFPGTPWGADNTKMEEWIDANPVGAENYLVAGNNMIEPIQKATEAKVFSLEAALPEANFKNQGEVAAFAAANAKSLTQWQQIQWKAFWVYPASASAVILVLFFLLFRDEKNKEEITDPAS